MLPEIAGKPASPTYAVPDELIVLGNGSNDPGANRGNLGMLTRDPYRCG